MASKPVSAPAKVGSGSKSSASASTGPSKQGSQARASSADGAAFGAALKTQEATSPQRAASGAGATAFRDGAPKPPAPNPDQARELARVNAKALTDTRQASKDALAARNAQPGNPEKERALDTANGAEDQAQGRAWQDVSSAIDSASPGRPLLGLGSSERKEVIDSLASGLDHNTYGSWRVGYMIDDAAANAAEREATGG